MQPATVTLSVDTTNDGTPENLDYTRYQEFQDRSVYITASHALDSRDTLGLYRTFPTKNGNFKGTAKSAIKFTTDIEVPGVDSSTTLTSPLILEVAMSAPVGATAAQLVEIRQRAIAALDDDTFMNALQLQLQV